VNATSSAGKPRGRRKGRAGKPRIIAPIVGVHREDRSDVAAAELYGALDLGTNNCRLLIAKSGTSGFEVVDAFSRIVRLGEGIGQRGALGDAAMARTIEALRVCANKLKWHKVSKFRLIATEACRLAANGPAFIARVAAETGLVLEIIDRETEARLAAAGAEPLIEAGAETALIFDIGGGSTEVMWVGQKAGGYAIQKWTSLQAGVVTLSERFGGGKDVTAGVFAAMGAHVRELLNPFVAEVAAQNGGGVIPTHLLGTSGTVTTIAGVMLGLRRYDRAKVDGCWLRSEDAGRVTADLLAMSFEERTQNPCIGTERADLVLAGCAILEEIRLAFPALRIRVADRGLREGILTQLLKEDGMYGVKQ
jgi:exopolyphosphatase / guanosine-5'-triphosphate,3'-diphosphate pyrophosphatase